MHSLVWVALSSRSVPLNAFQSIPHAGSHDRVLPSWTHGFQKIACMSSTHITEYIQPQVSNMVFLHCSVSKMIGAIQPHDSLPEVEPVDTCDQLDGRNMADTQVLCLIWWLDQIPFKHDAFSARYDGVWPNNKPREVPGVCEMRPLGSVLDATRISRREAYPLFRAKRCGVVWGGRCLCVCFRRAALRCGNLSLIVEHCTSLSPLCFLGFCNADPTHPGNLEFTNGALWRLWLHLHGTTSRSVWSGTLAPRPQCPLREQLCHCNHNEHMILQTCDFNGILSFQ